MQWAKKGNTNYHHEGYDTKAKSIEKEIENYLNANPPETDEKVVLWITGIGTGGAIANIVAGDMINNNSNKKGIMREVYCYTYGAPLTVYNNADDHESKLTNGSRYDSIFNIVHKLDQVGFIPTNETGWTRYGMTAISDGEILNLSIVTLLNMLYAKHQNNTREYTYEKDDNLKYKLIEFYHDLEIHINEYRKNRSYKLVEKLSKYRQEPQFAQIVGYVCTHPEEFLLTYNKIHDYYYTAKYMLNENISWVVDKRGEVKEKDENAGTAIEPYLDKMGKWYVDNVYTYQVGSYGAKRYRTITIEGKNDCVNPIGYIFRITKDIITADNFIGEMKNIKRDKNGDIISCTITYEQNISLEEAKEGKLRKGTVQMSEDQVTYYDYERYQVEFKSRFKEHLNMCGEEAREKREEELTKKGVNPEEIYRYDKRADGKFFFDVDDYIQQEIVKRTKGIARGKYKYTNKEKSMELEVADDCSGFAEAVFLSFIKDHKFEGADKEKALWYGSSAYVDGTALKKLEKYGFKCYKAGVETKKSDGSVIDQLKNEFDKGLQYGDLVCANGHVEFYRDENHTFGWGNTHNSYEDNEGYDWVWSDTENCLYDKKLEKEDGTVSLSKSDKYVAVYRYIGGK